MPFSFFSEIHEDRSEIHEDRYLLRATTGWFQGISIGIVSNNRVRAAATIAYCATDMIVKVSTGWFRLNAQNCVPGNSSRRFFELDHEILNTYSGRQYLKLEEGFFLIWGFAVEISGF